MIRAMIALTLIASFGLAACGVKGPPVRPQPTDQEQTN
ncbi:MAG: lipoprotein [Rhodobiaceae bacterium]|nr:lipoprotein [Rhodobiaceae bacterium]